MTYRTIASRIKEAFKDRTGMPCLCGTQITKRNLRYYIGEFGERRPICAKCARIVAEYLEVV